MTTDETATVTDAFLAAITPARRRTPKHVIDDEDYAAMMLRLIRRLEERAIENAALLPLTVALAQRLSEVTNVAIAANAERYAVDPRRGASMLECARVLGIGKAAISQRRGIGDRIMTERIDAAGAVRFSEARREREIIERVEEHAETNLIEYRARHLRSVA
jgi:hypothetical protein